MSNRRIKILILALDGFDPDLFKKWKGDLPTLSRLADEGFFTPILSTIPPMTFPAWSTFLTGVNPGKHGIFDFTERLPERLTVRFINSSKRKIPTFLRIASDCGFKVGSVGLPTTYPPEPLSGFQIAGFDNPLPSKANATFIHPPELAAEIEKELGGYYFGNFNESRINRNWHKRILNKLLAGISNKENLLRLLLNKYEDLDILVFHVGETDTIGHHFWALSDDQSPRAVKSPLNDAIYQVYKAADQFVALALQETEPEHLIIVSDHGMGGTSDRMLYLNRYLEECGFLRFSSHKGSGDWFGRWKNAGMKWLPYHWQQQLFHLAGGSITSTIESHQRFGGIDWDHTIAYSEELNYFPSICLNVQGRERFGVVAEDEIEGRISEIENVLREWKDPKDGSPIVNRLLRREEIYLGPETENAPDIFLLLNQPNGYSYALGKSRAPNGRNPWRKLKPEEYIGRKGGTMNGSHRLKGTFILLSKDHKSIPPLNISLQDIAPTVLNILGINIPNYMDGKSLIDKETLINSPIFPRSEKCQYSPKEETVLQNKLSQLGYLG